MRDEKVPSEGSRLLELVAAYTDPLPVVTENEPVSDVKPLPRSHQNAKSRRRHGSPNARRRVTPADRAA